MTICPKCGGSDIHVKWHDKGEWVKPINARYYHTEELTAEILRHYCRGCGYEWNTSPVCHAAIPEAIPCDTCVYYGNLNVCPACDETYSKYEPLPAP